MANFSTIPYTGGVVSSGPRDLSWIEISPSKVALIYTATFNGTSRQVFIQMVTFSGSAAPVYGTPCSLGTISNLTASTFMRGAFLRDNLLVMTIPVSYNGSGTAAVPNAYTYNVIAFDGSDRFNLVSNSTTVTTASTTVWPGYEMASYNGRLFSMRRDTDASHSFTEITVDVNNAITLTSRGSLAQQTTGVQSYSMYSRKAGKYWYFNNNAHPTVTACNLSAVVDLSAATYTAIPTSSMSLPSQANSLGRGRITTPTGSCVLELDYNTTSFTRFSTAGAIVTTAAYRSAVTGGIDDVMWLDNQHFIMLLNSATTYTDARAQTTTQGSMSVQVCRFDENTNSMTVSGAPKSLGTTAFRENFGNYLHQIDASNIAVIGGYQFATPSSHAGYGVQVLSI